jgi:hypothetical protein
MNSTMKMILSGSKMKVFNPDNRISFVMQLPVEMNLSMKNILEIADTKVHNGFQNMVSEVSLFDGGFSEMRKAEQSSEIPFVLVRSSQQTILKMGGQTIFSK